MKSRNPRRHAPARLLAVWLTIAFCAFPVFAQQTMSDLDKAPRPVDQKSVRERQANDKKTAGETAKPGAGAERQALRREDQSEAEASILPYLNSFFATTRLGPEDVITVEVFDQPNYSRSSITVPPNGRVNYPVIGQVMVAGRTTEEIEKDLTDRLSEYIREPKVTVQMVQIHSMKYMVVGDVTTPGIYEMTRRMTVNEAMAKAGDATRHGDLKKISVIRLQPDGKTAPIPVNLSDVRRGKAQDVYLIPGDTIVVPGNKFKTIDKLMSLTTLGYWMRVIVP
ncbi:MAG: polysaccharide biosynthesis/export family protein [Blastocatellia bacterium]